jgi:hypothetical protein
MSLAILFHFLCLNMFRTLIYPSSGACDYSVELLHWSIVLGSMWVGVVSVLQAEACNTDHNRTSVVIQQNSRKLLMMDILMSETCWAHKKWNKIASDIKLVFYSSTVTMMHGPINIIFYKIFTILEYPIRNVILGSGLKSTQINK